MKKLLLSFAGLLMMIPAIKAQTPDVIYIGTWSTMQELGTAITPNSDDPQLTYNSTSGTYEGVVIDWPKVSPNPYIAKIPYSVTDNVVTYYGVAGPSQQLIFNTNETAAFEFTSNTDPSAYKGFVLSGANANSVEDVKISMNLTKNVITFTQFESGEGTQMPELLSVDPENGSLLVPAADGSVTITLTFSSEVSSMQVLSEDASVTPVASDNGTVWTIVVPASVIEYSSRENSGNLVLKIQNVYYNGLPVGFPGGMSVLGLSYPVSGITNVVEFNFVGNPEALATLKVYRSPEYSEGDEINDGAYSMQVTYTSSVTYLITVDTDDEIVITSTVSSDNGENWATGTGYSTKKDPVTGVSTNQVAQEGVTLTLYPGANEGVFTIACGEDAGIESIIGDKGDTKIYRLDGTRVDANKLSKGIYIINGKKVIL